MSKGGGSSTVTNVQQLPPAIAAALNTAYTNFNPFQQAFDAVGAFDPTATKVGTAGLSTGESNAITAANNLLANQPAFLGTAQQNLGGLMGGAVDNTALANQLGLTADTTNLQNLLGATTDTAGILAAAQNATDASNIMAAGGQQNAATDLLTGLAGGGTNPFLQQQIDDAIGGAVNNVSSQYALGGRLGSDSFADSLGAGITGAAAPILAQNLQQDRANQLNAAQALGQVSGQDIGRSLQAAQSAAGIQQSDLGRALQGVTTAAQLGQQDVGQQGNIAQSLLGAQQTDLGRDATLSNQLTAASEADARARLAAIGAAPGLLGADQALISQAAQLGGLARGVDQAALDATAAQAAQQNVLDQNQINALLQSAGMGSGLFGSASTQTQSNNPSFLDQASSAATTAAALATLFSDERLKENITKIGVHKNGLNIYSWDWNKTARSFDDDLLGSEFGFIAQEAQQVYPEHVYKHSSGYLMLNYDGLGKEVQGVE